MKKMIPVISILMTLAGAVQAAPYYEGPGCNEEGTSCLFGTPSKRVTYWAKKGTIDEMGTRCEKFITAIEARKNEIAKSRDVVLAYKKFTYFWSNERDSRGHAKINCKVELHSELAHVEFETRSVQNLFWVCSDQTKNTLCAHSVSECYEARDRALKNPEVLDATIYFDGSLLQGNMCNVVSVKFK